jgi:hypothetical protein
MVLTLTSIASADHGVSTLLLDYPVSATREASMKGWVIDRDYLYAPEFDDVTEVGVGQRDVEQVRSDNGQVILRRITVERGLKASEVENPVRFRIRDEDGEVYYGGAISREWLGDDELVEAPLSFATANAGATVFEVRDGNGKWEAVL